MALKVVGLDMGAGSVETLSSKTTSSALPGDVEKVVKLADNLIETNKALLERCKELDDWLKNSTTANREANKSLDNARMQLDASTKESATAKAALSAATTTISRQQETLERARHFHQEAFERLEEHHRRYVVVGGVGGGIGGAAAVGFVAGNVPGAVIGGIVGAFGGAWGGHELNMYYQREELAALARLRVRA